MAANEEEFPRTESSLHLDSSWDRRLIGESFEPYYQLTAMQLVHDQIMPFVDYHPVYGERDADFRVTVVRDMWEHFRTAGLGEMVTLTDVQKEYRWYVWQAVTYAGGVGSWLDRNDRLPGEDRAYRMELSVAAHRAIHADEAGRISAAIHDGVLLNDLLRRTLAATMSARAATLQLAVVSEADAHRRGGILKRWRVRRAAKAATPGVVLAVTSLWGEWPHQWWETTSGIGQWRPDDSALDHLYLIAKDSRDADPLVLSSAVADARTASEILGWLTMAALDGSFPRDSPRTSMS